MSSPVGTFLKAVAERIEELEVVARVWISPGVDVERLLRQPRFPTVMLTDEGGRRHPEARTLDQRRFSLTVVMQYERDFLGEAAELELLDLVHEILDGVNDELGIDSDTENAITSLGDDATRSVITERGIMLVSKRIVFEYILDLTPPEPPSA